MSEQPAHNEMLDLLEFDQGERMRKALKVAGISVTAMAEYMGVARETVSTWLNGHNRPATAAVKLWALRTGAPYEWIVNGFVKQETPPLSSGGESLGVRAKGLEPPTSCTVVDLFRWRSRRHSGRHSSRALAVAL